MVLIGSVRCENFKQDIVAPTFALIAPVWRILQQVSCSSKTVPNAPKQKRNTPKHEFRVERCGSGAFVAKIHTNFCINCTSLARFALSFVWQRNGPKRTQTEKKHENVSLGSNYM